jgi:hypothetical protein
MYYREKLMGVLQRAAAITAFVVIAAVVVFARPLNKTAAPVAPLASVQAAISQK